MQSAISRFSLDSSCRVFGALLSGALLPGVLLSTAAAQALAGSVQPSRHGPGTSSTTVDWSRGPLTGAPLAFFHRHSARSRMPVRNGRLIYKPHGFGKNAALEWVRPTFGPSFNFERELKWAGWFPGLEIDASSLGMDWILADQNGVATVPPAQWGAVEFSIRKGSKGTGVIKRETNADSAAGADVFTYVLPGSALPPDLVGETVRGQDASEINIGGVRPGSAEIIAMDRVIPLLRLESDFVDSMTKPIRFFFSLTGYGAKRVPAKWFGRTRPSGASILYVTWIGESWSFPRLFRSYRDLGLGEREELDALSVDLERRLVLFSTKTAWRDELLLHGAVTTLVGSTTYIDKKGEPVSKSIGILPDDDVDAVCATDPTVLSESRKVTWNGSFFQIGSPYADDSPHDPVLTGTALRDSVGGNPVFRINVLGWHPAVGPRKGYVFAHWKMPGSGAKGLLGWRTRNPSSAIAGDPVQFVYPVPVALSLTGVPLQVHTRQYDLSWSRMGRTHPIQIRM